MSTHPSKAALSLPYDASFSVHGKAKDVSRRVASPTPLVTVIGKKLAFSKPPQSIQEALEMEPLVLIFDRDERFIAS